MTELPGDPAPESADVERSIRTRIDEHRRSAAYGVALDLSRELLEHRRRRGAARPYEIRDAERLVATLEHIVAMPEAHRRELAAADALTPEIHDLYAAGRFADALESIERQLDVRRRLLGPRHPDTLACLNDVALVRQDLGDLDAAEAPTREALELALAIHGDEHPDVANTRNSLARLLWYRGDLDGAERELRQAVALWKHLLGTDPHVALGLHNLGRLHHDQGHFAAAEPLYRAALAMRRELDGPESESVVWTTSLIACLLADQGDHITAVAMQHDAVEIGAALLEHSRPTGHRSGVGIPPSYSFAVSTLAAILEAAGRLDEARDVARQSVMHAREEKGPTHADVAAVLLREGEILFRLGELDDAEACLDEAASIREAALGGEHAEMAFCHRALAHLAWRRGDLAEAEKRLERADALSSSPGWIHHPSAIGTLVELGALARRRGDTSSANTRLRAAAAHYEVARLRAGAGLARALALSEPYSHLAATCLAAGRDADAWPMLERSLGRVLADRVIAARQQQVPDDERAEERRLTRERSDLERRLSALEDVASDRDVRADVERLRTRLLDVEASLAELSQAIAARETAAGSEPIGLQTLQAALAPSRALLGWLDASSPVGEGDAWGYVVRDRGPVRWVPLPGPGAARRNVAAVLEHMAQTGASALGSGSSNDVDVALEALGDDRLAPLAPQLDGARELVVVPSSDMAGVPIEAFGVSDRRIGDRYAVSYAPSSTLYAWLAKGRPRSATNRSRRALIVGDPPFRPDHAAALEAGWGPDGSSPAAGISRHALRVPVDVLPRLAGTREEATRIRAHFADTTVLLGTDASEQALVDLAARDALRRFDVIHLATHAVVNPDAPELSALVLSQVDLPDPVEAALAGERVYRGLVTGRDIVREWRLDADLVTLSACGTGTGRRVRGEGLVGFVHAFLEAGARSVLVSLWTVDDRATALLMERFYASWLGAGMPKLDALCEAKRWLRAHRDDTGVCPYAHTFYWSPFVLFGDPD